MWTKAWIRFLALTGALYVIMRPCWPMVAPNSSNIIYATHATNQLTMLLKFKEKQDNNCRHKKPSEMYDGINA